MSHKFAEVTRGAMTLTVYYDESPTSPREWDNVGTMVCHHRRYDLGDEKAQNVDDYGSWVGWLEGEVLAAYPQGAVVALPLFLLDHSGITMRAGRGFGDVDSAGWDWGQVGWIFVSKARVFEELAGVTEENWRERATECMQAEVETYDMYLTGDVYGFVLEEQRTCPCCGAESSTHVDSCWGFYGDEGIRDMAGHVDEEYADLFEELLKRCL